jgi:hypothetical protein
VIQDRAGFHLPENDPRLPSNVRLLPPYSPELNPVEKLGDIVKDQICNRLYPTLRKLEDHLVGALRPWRTEPARVAALIGRGWLSTPSTLARQTKVYLLRDDGINIPDSPDQRHLAERFYTIYQEKKARLFLRRTGP